MKTVNRSSLKACFFSMAMMTVVLFHCTRSLVPDNAGGSTSTVDNKVCGIIYDTNGKPVADVLMVMRSSDYIPHDNQLNKRRAGEAAFVCSTRTDRDGEFRFTARDSIPAGNYCIEGRDSSGNCLLIQNIAIDSSLLNSDRQLELSSSQYDTKLKRPGTIKGSVPLLGDSVSGTVYVYGLDTYAVIDSTGSFVLENMPAGNLRLNIVATGNGTAWNDTVSVTTLPADTTVVPNLPDVAAIGIDATGTYQTIDGFGASSAWIDSKITTGLATVFWKDDTVDGHIGLSLLRTRIDPKGYSISEASPMTKAIEANPDILIWSSSWTPPAKFKDNDNLVGGHLNSDSASMQGFADHLVKYVQDVKENIGINLYAVSCQNEPDSAGTSFDGCFWTGEQLRIFLKDFWGPAFESAGITAKRMIGESVRNDFAVSDPSLNDSASAAYVDIIGTHLYLGGPSPYPLAEDLDKPYWVTEISGLDEVDTSMADALMWANQVHDCLVRCNMSAYHYWWLVNLNADDNEGLCDSRGNPTPRMFALGNFSKFIRPGFVRVAATDSPGAEVKASAYYGESLNRLVIVCINSGEETKLDITIQGTLGGGSAVPWLTDSTHRLERQDPVTLSGEIYPCTLPARSVVTFVLYDVVIAY